MATIISLQYFWGLLLLSLSLYVTRSTPAKTPCVYIVYLGMNHIHDPMLTSDYHVQLLSKVFLSEEDAKQAMVYSYRHSFSGFSAILDSTQASALAKRKEVISVFKAKTLHLHTTRSWDFLGLTLANMATPTPNNNNITNNNNTAYIYGDDVVVGIIDSGIWPESRSFREDSGMKPIPSSWKGRCCKGEMFEPEKACNRKLIGARYYLEGFERRYGPLNRSGNPEYRSARDFLGHGTHTASTAVGSIVDKAISFMGSLGKGIARGGAPRARLAVYKACWGKDYESKCNEADVIAAFDDALYDGVHVISASIGVTPPLRPFFNSSTAIGSFHAAQLGVSVVFSAGNDGPDPGLVTNVAPWSISVAASSIDRMFSTSIIVPDANLSLLGESFLIAPIKANLVDAYPYFFNSICRASNRRNVSKTAEGKVMICFSTTGQVNVEEAEEAARNASALALIFVEPTVKLTLVDTIPTLHLNVQQGTLLKNFLVSSRKPPVVHIEASKTIIGKSPAPTVAFFSSRGPSSLAPDILKPDISAPGVNILAAWPENTPPTVDPSDKRRNVRWNFQSGTSMSCPHVSAIVALLKSAHPHWSPAAIRSALVTTAYNTDKYSVHRPILDATSMKPSNPFDIGAGHVDPLKAFDPGLVYDMETIDYILFLCHIGYTQQQIEAMLILPPCPHPDVSTTCAASSTNLISNMNYPSITVTDLRSSLTLKRRVRNVGHNRNAIYLIWRIVKPLGVEVVIRPRVLVFSWFRQEITYYVTLNPIHNSPPATGRRCDFGDIVWSDGFHQVRSPLIVCVNNNNNNNNTTAQQQPPNNLLFLQRK